MSTNLTVCFRHRLGLVQVVTNLHLSGYRSTRNKNIDGLEPNISEYVYNTIVDFHQRHVKDQQSSADKTSASCHMFIV